MEQWLQAAGITSLCVDGVEADDLIAALARAASAQGARVLIASSDKDFMQVVGPLVGLVNPKDDGEAAWDEQRVKTKTGVAPQQIVDWLSLIGDAVDNIPGVDGVGPKTATQLLAQFGSVSAIYSSLDAIGSARLRTNLEQARDRVRLNQELIRLRSDMPCETSLEQLQIKPATPEKLAPLYRNWGFRGLSREVEGAPATQSELF
jgi:DNA polymerase-1